MFSARSLSGNELLRLFLLPAVLLFRVPAAGDTRPVYFSFLPLYASMADQGFAAHPSVFGLLEGRGEKEGGKLLQTALSYRTYPYDLTGFSADTVWRGRNGGVFDLSAFLYYSAEFPVYEVNGYYDPVWTGNFARPGAFFLDLSWVLPDWKYGNLAELGVSARFAGQDHGSGMRSGLMFGAVLYKQFSRYIRASASFSGPGFVFFRRTPGVFLPYALTLGVSGETRIYRNYHAVLLVDMDSVHRNFGEVAAGLENSLRYTAVSFDLILHYHLPLRPGREHRVVPGLALSYHRNISIKLVFMSAPAGTWDQRTYDVGVIYTFGD